MKAGPAVQGEESSLLLSPSVFQHSVTKTAEPPTSPTADLPSSLYSRTQLKDTLVHLIKVQTDPRTLKPTVKKDYSRLQSSACLFCRMMPISSVRSMRPTYRASRKASTTSSYNRKLRKQNVRLEPSQIHYIHYIDCFCCPDEHPFPRLLCALSLSFPISMLIYVHLPISFSPSTIMCTYFKGLVQYEALPLWRNAFHL